MKRKLVLLFSFLSLIFMCITIHAQEKWTDVNIKEEYDINTEFKVPKRSISSKNDKVVADTKVIMPDGTVTTKNTIMLETAGQYTVVYTAEVGKSVYVDEITFQVYNELYSVEMENSSVSYGTYQYDNDVEGLLIRLQEGDTFTLNKPIDVASLMNTESLFSAVVTPDTEGVLDFEKLCFKLTDAYDPSITLEIWSTQADWDPAQNTTYFLAGGNGQQRTGYESGLNRIHRDSLWGSPEAHCFSKTVDNNVMNIRLDQETMEIYANQVYIIDLNSPEYFNTLWEGFPSGKVYLTAWAELYSRETANFCLISAGNVELKEEKVVDAEPPIITVDSEYETMPNAVKGGRYQIIPSATAVDAYSGKREVKTSVWYNYNSSRPMVVDIEGGTFETARIGNYAIVYEAIDASGNQGKEILWVKSVSGIDKPTIKLTEKALKTYQVGQKFVEQPYTYECHSGKPDINIYAMSGKKKIDFNKGYLFEKEGTYKIVYEITDSAGQKAKYEFKANVKMGKTPVLVDEVVMPKYMITDSDYIFPEVYFNDYRSGKLERKIATGTIIDATGSKNVSAGDTYQIQVDNNLDTVKVIYKCEKATYEVEIPVIKAWQQVDGKTRLQLQNYFVGNGIDCTKGEEDMTLKATTADAGWTFANKLLSEGIELQFQGVSGKTNFDSLNVTLTDSMNKEEKLKVELLNTKGYLAVKVGNKFTYMNGISFESEKTITLKYKDRILTVDGVEVNIGDFTGFSSGYVYNDVHFTGAENNAEIKLLSISGHVTNSANGDRTEAKLIVQGDTGGQRQLGKKIILPTAIASDVLCPNVTFTMNVTFQNAIVKDINGVPLENVDPTQEYTILPEEYGQYSIAYTAKESFSEKTTYYSYILHVTDREEPIVEFSHTYQTEAKVGDTLVIPEFTVTDNITDSENIVIRYVIDPHGITHVFPKNSNSILASEEGKYTFTILVMDAVGNVCNETWTVAVTKD